MANCKLCKDNIPDGAEICDSCLEKDKLKESYLDSLLSSVINTAPEVNNSYKLKGKDGNSKNDHNKQTEIPEEVLKYSMNNASLEKSDEEILDENIYDIDISYDFATEVSEIDDLMAFDQFEMMEDLEDKINIKSEDIFGNDIGDIFTDVNKENSNSIIHKDSVDDIENNLQSKDNQSEQLFDNESIFNNNLKNEYDNQLQMKELEENQIIVIDKEDNNNEKQEDNVEEKNINEPWNISDLTNFEDIENNIIPDEINNFQDESELDNTLGNILDVLDQNNDISKEDQLIDTVYDLQYKEDDIEDLFEYQNEENEFDQNILLQEELANTLIEEELQTDETEEDFYSLLQQISEDDPVMEDVNAINEMLYGVDKGIEFRNTPSDVGQVFSDALTSVSSLEDYDFDVTSFGDDSNNNLSNLDQSKIKNNKKNNKDKKANKSLKIKKEKTKENTENEQKKGFFEKLFGNVSEDNKDKQIEKSSLSESVTTEAISKKAKKKKVAKNKKVASQVIDNNEDDLENNKVKDKKLIKKENKIDKIEKKKKVKEVKNVIDDLDVDEGRINRLGTSIVFAFFGLIVILLLIGTNLFSYSLSIRNATNYFDRQKYTEAYNEVYGINIKDEDIELYDKIMTVMFVNKQLNSYNNYYALKQYPEALDSLLKGLSRYDKYIELATLLGIKSDLNYVRDQILGELKNVFLLSEDDAINIIKNEDQTQYSLKVYDVVFEKIIGKIENQ